MTCFHNIIRAVGEFSPDDEWWGNVNKYPVSGKGRSVAVRAKIRVSDGGCSSIILAPRTEVVGDLLQ